MSESNDYGTGGAGPDTAVATAPSVVAVFATHDAAERAVTALERAGIDMRRISIVGKDYQTVEHPVGFYNVGDRTRVWGSRGAFWGALLGILVSPALFLIPVLGHVIVLGPLTSAIVGMLEGAAVTGGLSALAGALASIGIPRDSVIRYEAAIKADKFVLVVHDARTDSLLAEQVLFDAGAESTVTYAGEL